MSQLHFFVGQGNSSGKRRNTAESFDKTFDKIFRKFCEFCEFLESFVNFENFTKT